MGMGEILVRESVDFKRWVDKVGGTVEPTTNTISSICKRYLEFSDARQ